MTAEKITNINLGASIGGGSATTTTGLISGIYELDSTENDDWIILSEFKETKFVVCVTESSGALATEAVTIDSSTTNKLVFTAGSTDTIRVLVYGTPAEN